MAVLRKLRLLFERFPPKHNLVLFGQPELLYALSMKLNEDLKSRITFSKTLQPLNDRDIEKYILTELETVHLGPTPLMIRQLRSSNGRFTATCGCAETCALAA